MSVTGKKRQGNDKFYTNPDIALACFNTFKKYITHKNCVIIEPAAGNGAFLSPLADYNYKAYDILPENEGIILQDFLTLDLAQFQTPLYFIGNPPFGRQSSLAKKFIKHITACVNTAVIGFILPKSFKKESMQKTEYAPLLGIYKHTHDLLVEEAKQLSSSISTIEENSLSLWSDEESGQ